MDERMAELDALIMNAGNGVIMPQYSHRNGESEAPTVEGFYWLREGSNDGGVVPVAWQREIRDEHGNVDIRADWIIPGEIDYYVDEIDDAQWWGPVMPPWEQAP